MNAARPAWLVVGAPRNGSSGTESGASCVYRRGPSGWTYEDELAASNGSALAAFGDEVDVHGQTIVVAAPCAARRCAVAGAVYLFARGGFVWTELADVPPLTPSTEARRGNRIQSGVDPLLPVTPRGRGTSQARSSLASMRMWWLFEPAVRASRWGA